MNEQKEPEKFNVGDVVRVKGRSKWFKGVVKCAAQNSDSHYHVRCKTWDGCFYSANIHPLIPQLYLQIGERGAIFTIGDTVCAKDLATSAWFTSTILNVDGDDLGVKRVFVHYNGFSSKYDTWLDADDVKECLCIEYPVAVDPIEVLLEAVDAHFAALNQENAHQHALLESNMERFRTQFGESVGTCHIALFKTLTDTLSLIVASELAVALERHFPHTSDKTSEQATMAPPSEPQEESSSDSDHSEHKHKKKRKRSKKSAHMFQMQSDQ